MNTIELVVGGQTYAIACEAGEEEHVAALGQAIDDKFVDMGPRYAQNLLFAALQLADGLHEARKATSAAEADKRKLQDGFDAYRAKSAELRRQADTALGQQDKLKTRIAELEKELDQMQSAQQSATEETKDVRQQLSNLREQQADWEATENRQLAEIVSLTEQLADAQAAPPPAPQPTTQSAPINDPEFPPALERFAQLLEETADKLEEKAARS